MFGLSRETVLMPVRAAAALYAHEAGDEAEAWSLAPGDRRSPRGGPHGGEAAAHGEAGPLSGCATSSTVAIR